MLSANESNVFDLLYSWFSLAARLCGKIDLSSVDGYNQEQLDGSLRWADMRCSVLSSERLNSLKITGDHV